MRVVAVVLCLIGAVLVAAGAIPLSENHGALEMGDWVKGFLGILLGLALGAVGLILHLAGALLRLLRHRESLDVRISASILGVEVLQLSTSTDDEPQLEGTAGIG